MLKYGSTFSPYQVKSRILSPVIRFELFKKQHHSQKQEDFFVLVWLKLFRLFKPLVW
jgi:hypothetical protein